MGAAPLVDVPLDASSRSTGRPSDSLVASRFATRREPPGYYFRAVDEERECGAVILLNGYDRAVEETYFGNAQAESRDARRYFGRARLASSGSCSGSERADPTATAAAPA
jgi:hypothetical protein